MKRNIPDFIKYQFIFKSVFITFIFLFATVAVQAVTKTWTGVTGNWTNALSWSPNGVPASGDDVVINSTGTVSLNTSATCKSFTLNTGTFIVNNATSYTLTISGNYSQTGGTFDFNSGTSGNSIVNIGGNLSNTAGTGSITTSGSNTPNGYFIFNGSGIQKINIPTVGAAIWAKFQINSGVNLQLISNLTLSSANTSSQLPFVGEIDVNGTLDLGSYTITQSGGVAGSAIFKLISAATMITANTGGVDGSVPATNMTRTFSTGANYIYDGVVNQAVGNGLPATVNSLTVSNTGSAGNNIVTLAQNTAVTTNLNITSGILNLSTTTNTADKLTLAGEGTINGTWGSSSSSATNKNDTYFLIGNSGIITVASSNCTIPSAPVSGGNQSICANQAIPALTVTVGGGQTADWYSASTGGTLLLSGSLVYSPSSAGTYYAEAIKTSSRCKSSTRTGVTLTVNSLPTAVTASGGGTFCASTTITASNGGSGTIYFQGTNSGGISTATPSASQVVSSTGIYYFRAQTASGCWGTEGSVAVTINTIPSAPTVSTITQPTCSVATGGVNLTGLPATGIWTLIRTPGGIATTGSGTNTTISGLAAGNYTFTVTNEDNSNSCPGSGTGLKAEYFNNMALTGLPTLTRTDATVNFNWGNGSPDPSIPADLFSARWTGKIQPCYTESYTFTTTSDDGIRLWVDGTQIINNWTDHGVVTNTGTILLNAGQKYDIVLEFYENGGQAVATLSWSSTSQANQIIPARQLYSVTTGCTSSISANVGINSQPTLPVAAGTITGATTVCQGANGVTYTVPTITNATGYKWSLPTGASITAGSNTNSITVSYSTSATSGNVSVYGTNACGNGTASSNYAVTVNPLPLAPTAVSASKTYTGIANSTIISATPAGGETIDWYAGSTGGTAIATGNNNYTPTAVNAGTYTYYAEARNTTTGCVSATRTLVMLTINKAVLTITAGNQTVTYGTLVATVTGAGTYTPTGFVNSETATVIGGMATYTTAYTAVTAAGTAGVTITPVVTSLTASNYSFTPANGTITISKAALTVTSSAQSKTYGTVLYLGTSAFTSSGLQNGETIANVSINSAGAAAIAVAGSYPIVASAATGGTFIAGNYNISYVDGTLTVNNATITVTAVNKVMTYGDATPMLTYTMTGFAGTDTEATAVTGTPSLSTVYTNTTLVSATPETITAAIGTLAASNYSFSFSNGTVTVNAKALTITANSRSKCVGEPVSFNGTEFLASGLINGDILTSITLSSAGAASGALTSGSPYSIVPSGAAGSGLGNYNISYVNGTLTVNALPAITGTSPGSRCGAGTVTLGATALSGTINWYDALTGGSSLGTGTSFTTPDISTTTTYYVDANSNGCTSATRTAVVASVIPEASISAGGDGTFCAGTTLNLTSSGTNITNQYWQGPNSFYSLAQNPTISNATSLMSGTYTVTGSSLSGVNLVSNGNFESGNTPPFVFGSDYIYSNSSLTPEGTYSILTNPQSLHSSFSSCAAHSASYQMVINGSITVGKSVWSQTVNVVPGTDYQFTYWVQSLVGNNPSELQLYVNGDAAGPVYTAITETCQWKQFTYNWNSGSGTTALLSLVNKNTVAGGNDFALDDIVFQQVCAVTASVVITVQDDVTPGVIGTPQIICNGATPSMLTSTTPGTGSGTISYEWQSNASGSFVTVGSAISSGYQPPALMTTTSYRRRSVSLLNGVKCYSGYTTPVAVSVDPVSVGGTVSGGTTLCTGSTSGLLTLSGQTGTVTRWQSSVSPFSTWTDISNNSTTYTSETLTQTTQFRAVVTSGVCSSANSAATTIIITALPVATFSYDASPYCNNAANPSPTFSGGGVAGTFSSTAGLVFISTATGQINLTASTAGTYTLTNTIAAAGGCGVVTATSPITITILPAATISYAGTPFCKSLAVAQPVTRTGTAGGTYTAAPAGLTIDGPTGAITPGTSTAGTYTVTYTMAASGGCAAQTATASVTVTAVPTATISYTGTPFCISVATAQAVTLNGTGAYISGTYSAPTGLTIDSSTGAITPGTSTAGTYTVTYSTPFGGGCTAVPTTTSVTITAVPTATISYAGSPFSISIGTAQAITLTGTGAYSGGTYSAPAGLTIDSSTGDITPGTSTAGIYTVTYSIPASGGCGMVTATTSVTILNIINVSGSTGADGTYGSLTNASGAFAAINTNDQTGKTIIITIAGSSIAETGLNSLNAGVGAWTALSLYPIATGVTISGNVNAPLINLNGADNVTIDGRVNSTGTAKDLTIINSNTGATASTIKFILDAQNNIIQNCIIEGSGTGATAGTIFFHTGLSVGNDNNTISNNTITSAGSNLPVNAIYSSGTSAAIDNSVNTISGNNIQDYFSPALPSNGILVAGNNSGWSISNNKFYQTATRTTTGGTSITHRAIQITSGNGYTISGNTIGFSSSDGTGIMTYTNGGGTTTPLFRAIEITATNISASSIQGNVISGINFSTTSASALPGVFSGISVLAGNVNIGTVTGNTIGAATGNGSINITSTATGVITGINSTSTGTVNIQNNIIGSMSTGSTAAIGHTFYGIYTAGTLGNYTISSNFIGSSSTLNSISMGDGSTTTAVCTLNGITNAATGTISISGNTVQNATVYSSGASVLNGILNSAGSETLSITGNKIISVNNTGTGTITGLSNTTTLATPANVNNNEVSTSTLTGSGAFTGITSSTTGAVVSFSGNLVKDINRNTAGAMTGISVTGFAGASSVITNTVTNISGQAAITGMSIGSIGTPTSLAISENVLTNLVSSGTGGSVIALASSNLSLSELINNNTINTLSSSGTTASVTGITITAGAGVSITNHKIYGLSASGTSTPIITGISVASTGTVGISGNKIYGISTAGIATSGYTFRGIYTSGALGNFTISNNEIGGSGANSVSIGSSGTTTAVCTLNGITNAATGTISITGNTIQNSTVYSSGASVLNGILNSAGTGTLNITGNNIIGVSNTGTGAVFGISNSSTAATTNINSNVVRNIVRTTITGTVTGISSTGAITGALNINDNQLGSADGGFVTFNAASSGTLTGITATSATGTCALSIQRNDFIGISYATSGTGAHTYIINGAATLSQNISNNTFTNLDVNTTGAITFISNTVVIPANGTQTVSGNSIVTGFNKGSAGGTITLFTSTALTVASGVTVTHTKNNFSNITLTGATTIAGWVHTDAGVSTKTFSENTFNNWNAGTGTITQGMLINGGASGSTITNNTLSHFSTTGAITGLISGVSGIYTINGNNINTLSGGGVVIGYSIPALAATINFNNNTINTLSTTAGGTNSISGILAVGATALTIDHNTINGIQSTGVLTATGSVRGIALIGGTVATINDNTIYTIVGNAATTGSVNGMLISAGTNVNAYKNNIYDLQGNSVTSGSVNGLLVTGGAIANAYQNKIYDLSSSSTLMTTGTVNGMVVSGAVASLNATLHNNTIGDLRVTAASGNDLIRGISVINTGATSNVNLYYNTINLNAASSGTNFGTTGIYHTSSATATTSALDMRNNLIVNLSTPKGTGKSVAYRRFSSTLTNYSVNSNNNSLYAGLAGSNNLIFYDGTNSDQALAAYKTRVATRDQASLSVSPEFISTSGSNITFLHLKDTNCALDGAGIPISGITIDFDNDTRDASTPDIGADEFVLGSPKLQVSVSIVADPSTTICNGTSVTFTATPTNGGAIPTYQWYNGAVQVGGNNPTYTSAALSDGASVTVQLSSNDVCTTGSPATSNAIVMTVTTLPIATFNYADSPYCSNAVNPSPTFTGGGVAGTFSSTAGLVFVSTATGQIDLTASAAGTYIVTNTIAAAGGCAAVTSTNSVFITTLPVATISYVGTPFCSNAAVQSVTRTGTTGGTYSVLPAGLTIDPSSGAIIPSTSTAGTYTITYTMAAAGGCGVQTATASVTVTAVPTATISYTGTPFCISIATAQAVTLNGTGAYTLGTYSAPAGLTIDSSTGAITPVTSTAGMYIVTYNTPVGGGCAAIPTTASVTITAVPVATFSYTGSPYCSNAANPSPAFSGGGVAGTFSSTTGLVLVNNATGEINLTASTSGTYIVTNTIAAAGGCGIVSTTSSVTILPDGSWTGNAHNNDWNNPANWACNQLPSITTNVIIASGKSYYPTLSTGAVDKSNNLTIESGASVTVSGNTLQIAGTITNNGIFTASSGTIEMIGSTIQTIPANTFAGDNLENLIVTNPSKVTLGGGLNITGIVKVTSGELASAGYLKLISSAIQTALIDGSGGGQVTGNVTMQRYLLSAFGYKYFSAPFQAATVAQFTGYLSLTATIPNFYRYDENNSIGGLGVNFISGWAKWVVPANPLIPLTGYAANLGNATTSKIVEITGEVNNGNLTPLTLHNNNRSYTKGFNLVGNPYPSPVDWNKTGWTKTNIDNAIYFFDASGAANEYSGTYCSYVNGTSTGGSTNIIPSMQGFFVHVTDGAFPVSATFGVSNTVRTNDLTPTFKAAIIDNRPILRFAATFETKNAIADAAIIYFDDAAKQSFDKDLDALKMMNTDLLVPNLYSISTDARQLSINGMPQPADSDSKIPLGITTLSDGWINFNAKDISRLPSSMHIYLVDSEQGVTQDLNQQPEYRFYLKTGEYNSRFSLVFSLTDVVKLPVITEKMFTISRSGNQLQVKINLPINTGGNLMVTNVLGQVILQKAVSGMETVEVNPYGGSSIYIVTLVSGTRKESEKILIRKDYE